MYKLYALRDVVSEEFGPIFQSKNDGSALRVYLHMLQQEKKSQDEFKLYAVGTYIVENGLIDGFPAPVQVTLNSVANSEVRSLLGGVDVEGI